MSIVSSTNEVQVEQIAERVRALVSGRYGERVFDAAICIGVSDVELSALLVGRTPVAKPEALVDALARVVRHFGVDPTWLVTGRYNVQSHIAAEELGTNLVGLRFLVRRLLSGPDRAVEVRAVERADLRPPPEGSRSPNEWPEAPAAQPDHDARSPKSRRSDEPER